MIWPALVLAAAAVVLVCRWPVPSFLRLTGAGPWWTKARTSAVLEWSGGRSGRTVTGCAAGCFGGILAGPIAGALAGAVAVSAVVVHRNHRRELDQDAERVAAGEAVSVVVAELRAGRPAGTALAAAADVPGCEALSGAARAVLWGAEPAAALAEVAGPGPMQAALRRVAVAWVVAERCGAGLADALARVEQDLRADADRRAAVSVELAGITATTRVLAVLPVLGLLLGQGMGAHPVHVLLHTTAGAGCALLGGIFEGAGVIWTHRLRSAVRDGPR